MNEDSKPSLIDLEADSKATGRKQEKSVQRERLSERAYMYCVYWIRLEDHKDVATKGYVGITSNLTERLRAHKKNKRHSHFTSAIKKYGWEKLIVEILHESLSLQDALSIEAQYRPVQQIGWNCQRGGELGVEKSWYDNEDNRHKHSKATSEATIRGIYEKDNSEARSERARLNWIKNKESYEGVSKGSKNPKAKLTEEQVKEIRYSLLPSDISVKQIADKFGVKPYVVYFIKYNKTWQHV